MVDETSVDITSDVKSLGSFVKELEKILADLKKSAVLDKASSTYQNNLKKLIDSTNKIIDNTATTEDTKNFEKLIKTSEASFKVLQKNNKNDEEFKGEFKDAFGEMNSTTSPFTMALKSIGATVGSLTHSVDLVSQETRTDVKDTGMGFISGPFGKIMENAVGDMGGIKDSIASKFADIKSPSTTEQEINVNPNIEVAQSPDDANQPQILGQAHDGMTHIPKEGTYTLDKGERVVAPEQNQDLTSFIRKEEFGKDAEFLQEIAENTAMGGKPIEVFNKDHDSRYFDSILDNDDRMFNEEANRDTLHHKEIKTKFEILGDILSAVSGNWLSNFIIGMDVFYNRFKRHPLLMTMGIVLQNVGRIANTLGELSGMASLFRGFKSFLFGTKAKDDTERVVQANEDITDAVNGIAQRDRRGLLERGKDATLGEIRKGFLDTVSFGKYDNEPRRVEAEAKQNEDQTDTMGESNTLLTDIFTVLSSMFTLQRNDSIRQQGVDNVQLTLDETMQEIMMKNTRDTEEILEETESRSGGGLFSKMGNVAGIGALLGGIGFGGFKLGEMLNEKFGEWLDLEMDFGSWLGNTMYDFFDSIGRAFSNITDSIEENGFWGVMKSVISGEGIPDSKAKIEYDRMQELRNNPPPAEATPKPFYENAMDVKADVVDAITPVFDTAKETMDEIRPVASALAQKATDTMSPVMQTAKDAYRDAPSATEVVESASKTIKTITEPLRNQVNALGNQVINNNNNTVNNNNNVNNPVQPLEEFSAIQLVTQ